MKRKARPREFRLSRKTLDRMRDRVRRTTRRVCGRSMAQVVGELRSFLLGWRGYFRLADTPRKMDELDGWIRRRLRALQLKQWKRGKTAYRELRNRGASETLLPGSLATSVVGGARRSCSCTTSSETRTSRSWGYSGSVDDLNLTNRRGTDPYARWRGRGSRQNQLPAPLSRSRLGLSGSRDPGSVLR